MLSHDGSIPYQPAGWSHLLAGSQAGWLAVRLAGRRMLPCFSDIMSFG